MCFANGMAINAAINGVMIVFGGALLLAFCLVALGLALSRSKRPNTRVAGAVLGLLGYSIPFVCCLSFVNFNDRSGLRQSIKEGMTEAQAFEVLGQPDSKSSGMWYYYAAPTKLIYFGVSFGENGLVDGTYIE